MSDNQEKFAYSMDEEAFIGSITSKIEAISEGLEAAKDEEREHFWIGECHLFAPSGMANTVIDQLQSDASDHAGEYADGYLDHVSKEERAVLETFIMEWANKIETPGFYSVDNVVKYTIAEAEAFLSAQPKEPA